MTDSTNIAGARPAYDFEPIRTRGAARRTARAGGNVDLRIAKAHVLSMLAHPSRGSRRCGARPRTVSLIPAEPCGGWSQSPCTYPAAFSRTLFAARPV